MPTILDRIAQEVVRSYLEPIVEPHFHSNSYGYRRGRSCHDAVDKVLENVMTHDWIIDLDIQSFFDTIDHNLMMKAVAHYCKEKWVLLYVSRWLKAGIVSKDGALQDRITGIPQGGVVIFNFYINLIHSCNEYCIILLSDLIYYFNFAFYYRSSHRCLSSAIDNLQNLFQTSLEKPGFLFNKQGFFFSSIGIKHNH